MNKKILIIIGVIAVLVLGAALYLGFLPKEKKPVDILKQRLESVSTKLVGLSSKASELKNLASKAEAKLQEAGETDKVQACQEAIAFLDEISRQANELSQRAKQMKEDIEAVEKAKIPKEAKTSLVLELKQLRRKLISFRQELGRAKQDILNYAEIIRDPTNTRESLQFANRLKKFTKNIEEVEREINQTTSGIDNYISVLPEGPTRPTKLSQVKVASVYQKVTDGKLINRSIDDVIEILKETKTDFIFRGFWIWGPCANKCSDLPPEVLKIYKQKGFDCEKEGHSYTHLRDSITKIKKEMPDIIFCGAIPAQRINFIEINPITGRVYNQQETNAMALDPAKWGITNVSKKQLQEYFQEHGTGGMGYFPDITNYEFQNLMLSWAKKQIDCGADAIWIDALFAQARVLEKITKNPNHPAVRESFEVSSKIVDEIHKYGQSKGKYIYVGTWWGFVELPYSPPNLDFVTLTPSPAEVSSMRLDESKWDGRLEKIRSKVPDVPIFAFIDWAGTVDTPLGKFSRSLTPENQREFLRTADEFFTKKGIKFVYPVHGGFMGAEATRLSFGRFKIYDSLAPEFQTYETIKELAQKKARKETGEVKVETICTDGIDNDGDGLADNEDGDCWIREGPIYIVYPYDISESGTFRNLSQKVPELKDLGINTIYLMPIWEHVGDKSHPYGVLNYYELNSEFGNEADLHELVSAVHDNDMKIIFDLVTAYTPEGSWIYNKHPEWLLHDASGKILNVYPRKEWGPAVDRANPELIDYFANVAKYYIQEYDIDGWRLDAPQDSYNLTVVSGDHSAMDMLRKIKKEIISVKPDAILLAENPSSDISSKPLFDKVCEISYSYAFSGRLIIDPTGLPAWVKTREDVFEYFDVSNMRDLYRKAKFSFRGGFIDKMVNGEANSKDLVNFLRDEHVLYNRSRARFLENQDTARIQGAFPNYHKLLLVLISTIPGVPMIHAGQEVGEVEALMGDTVDWTNGDYKLRDFYKKVFKIRNLHPALKYGIISNVWKSGDNIYAYSRTYENETVIVVISFQGKTTTSILNLPFKVGSVLKDELSGETFTVSDPTNSRISVPAYGSRILTLKGGR